MPVATLALTPTLTLTLTLALALTLPLTLTLTLTQTPSPNPSPNPYPRHAPSCEQRQRLTGVRQHGARGEGSGRVTDRCRLAGARPHQTAFLPRYPVESPSYLTRRAILGGAISRKRAPNPADATAPPPPGSADDLVRVRVRVRLRVRVDPNLTT